MKKQGIYIYDIETLANLFTYTGTERDTKEIVQFTIWKDVNELEELVKHLNSVKGLVGFNNISFDYPVLHFILTNYHNWGNLSGDEITSLIYEEAQKVIHDEWSQIKDIYVKIPQLDLFRIWHYNNKARMTSLKKLQIALRYPNVQDMPYQHYEEIHEYNQVKEILDYNLNDVESTLDFYERSVSKIDLRRSLYQRYGLNCMNFPDSKIGEDLTLKLYCDETGENINEVKKKRTRRSVFKFKECFPKYLHFETEEFNELRKYLEGIVVTELKGAFKYSFEYKGFTFDLGTGGIHGCIKSGVYDSNDSHVIIDIDVASLYPSLAIANNLYPAHLGEEFTSVYENGIVLPRLEAKKKGDMVMSDGFKLSANSVYGKSNSEYSWLYDPLYTLKTTLAGQLSLCMLSEQIMTSVEDVTFLQINTDGLTVLIDRNEVDKFFEVCKSWEKETGLILEDVVYSKMIIRDVNNYIAVSENGKIKRKGVFVTYEQMLKEESFHKSLSFPIVPEAVGKYFLEGIPIEQSITQCTNIYDFCLMFNASHGWYCELVDSEGNTERQQKTNRYFMSTNGKTFRKVKADKIIEIEAGGKLVTIFNQYEDKEVFTDYEIDYQYYIDECYKLIHVIDGTKERELEEAKQRKEQEKRDKEEEKFVKYCVDKVPTVRQLGLYGKDWLLEKYGTPKTK